MLWKIIWSNFENILLDASAFKKFPSMLFSTYLIYYILLPVHKWVHMIDYQWFYHNIHSALMVKNDCHIQMHVVYIIWKIGTDLTDAYINTIIIYQENPHSTHVFLSSFVISIMVITDYTYLHFPALSCVCPSHLFLNGVK